MSEGIKYDKEKCRMELFPPDAYEEICNILTFGAKKYPLVKTAGFWGWELP